MKFPIYICIVFLFLSLNNRNMILSQQLGGLLAPNSNPFLHNSVESGFNAFTD